MSRTVVITGIGLVTSLAEGGAANRDALLAGAAPVLETASTPPFPIHPLVPLDLDKQIPKKGDQRQMEPWQRIGTYAAGLALADAGIAGDAGLLARTHMIVAAGGGERDVAVDQTIMSAIGSAPDKGAFLNERLSNDLRPTLFLAQLSNLLAGNISIVHGVTGSSRTFMGEEASGVDAMRTIVARIAAGQADIGLVGGAYNAARPDMQIIFSFIRALWDGEHAPVWARGPNGGMIMGSVGAFLVVEAREHAEARGARVIARLGPVLSDRSNRQAGAALAAGRDLLTRMAPHLREGPLGVLSGATGREPVTGEERDLLADFGASRPLAVRATGTILGHSIEPAPVANVALAALALEAGTFYPPLDDTGMEVAISAPPSQILVTSFGHWRGEGLVLVERA